MTLLDELIELIDEVIRDDRHQNPTFDDQEQAGLAVLQLQCEGGLTLMTLNPRLLEQAIKFGLREMLKHN